MEKIVCSRRDWERGRKEGWKNLVSEQMILWGLFVRSKKGRQTDSTESSLALFLPLPSFFLSYSPTFFLSYSPHFLPLLLSPLSSSLTLPSFFLSYSPHFLSLGMKRWCGVNRIVLHLFSSSLAVNHNTSFLEYDIYFLLHSLHLSYFLSLPLSLTI